MYWMAEAPATPDTPTAGQVGSSYSLIVPISVLVVCVGCAIGSVMVVLHRHKKLRLSLLPDLHPVRPGITFNSIDAGLELGGRSFAAVHGAFLPRRCSFPHACFLYFVFLSRGLALSLTLSH